MTTWTREHDAVIARECEGVGEIFKGNQNWVHDGFGSMKHNPMDMYYVAGDEHGHAPVGVPHYSTDLSAIARAGEAWRTKDEDIDRTIQVNSPVERMGLPFRVECSENYRVGENYEWRTFKGGAEDETLARAWALYNAVKGTK